MFPTKPTVEKGSTDDGKKLIIFIDDHKILQRLAIFFSDDERAPLPPEMYINQQKWLELRAKRRSALISCICNNINIVS